MKLKFDKLELERSPLRNPGVLLGKYRGEPCYWAINDVREPRVKIANYGSARQLIQKAYKQKWSND